MDIGNYIDLLLKKYAQAPDYPFANWTEDPVSFYALMNLWDEIFKTASGQKVALYAAVSDAEMDIDSNIYDVVTQDRTRRVSIHPELEGACFL